MNARLGGRNGELYEKKDDRDGERFPADSTQVSVTFLVGINRFFPENFPQNQNNLPC